VNTDWVKMRNHEISCRKVRPRIYMSTGVYFHTQQFANIYVSLRRYTAAT